MGSGLPFDVPVLSALIALPAATALVLIASGALLGGVARTRGLPDAVWRAAGLASSIATFAIAIVYLYQRFDPEHIGPQLVEYVPWHPALGVQYFVGVDGISLFLVLLTTLLVPVLMLASWNQIDRSRRSFTLLLLLLESALLAVFLSLNVVLFYVAWQAALVPLFFLVGIWGGSRRVRAATRLLVSLGLGSALLLAAVLALLHLAGASDGSLDLFTPHPGGAPGLLDTDIATGAPDGPWWASQRWLFLAFALAFGFVIPVLPLHGWLPDAQAEAPIAGAALLSGVGLSMGAYGLLRFALPLFPNAVTELVPVFFGLALLGVLYGASLAAVQTDLKRLVGWWSIAHLGFVLLGVFSLDVHGLTGGIVAMLSHGLTVAALFVLVGIVVERRGSSEIATFGGLARPMPVFAAFLGISVLSAMGMPALSGFVGELLIVLGSFGVGTRVGLLACVGWVLIAGLLAWTYRRVALGPVDNPENRGLIDLGWRERAVLVALLVPIVVIGVYPNPVLRRVEPSVLELMRHMDERRVVAPVAPPETAQDARDPESEPA